MTDIFANNPFAVLALDVEKRHMVLLNGPDGITPWCAQPYAIDGVEQPGKQAYVCVLSSDSKDAAKARALAPAWLAAFRESKVETDLNDNALLTLYVASHLVVEWFMLTFDGRVIYEEDGTTPIRCTQENVFKLFIIGQRAQWVIQQVTAPIYARENFTPAPSTN